MSSLDFRDLISGSLEDIPDVVPLPEGLYIGRVASLEFKKTKDKEAPYIKFNLTLEAADDSVDGDELAKALASQQLSAIPMHCDYFLHTAKAKQRLRDFLQSCGHSGSVEKALANIVGQRVKAEVVRTPTKDGKDFFNNINQLVGIE